MKQIKIKYLAIASLLACTTLLIGCTTNPETERLFDGLNSSLSMIPHHSHHNESSISSSHTVNHRRSNDHMHCTEHRTADGYTRDCSGGGSSSDSSATIRAGF